MPFATINELEATYLRTALGSSALATDTLQDLRQKFYSNPPVRYGSGSPEGVVTAPVGTIYTDNAATNGAVEWTKQSGAGNTGWVVTNGDTGWRRLVNWDAAGVQTIGALHADWKPRATVGGYINIRRVSGLVQCKFTNVAVAVAGTANAMFPVPAGFQADASSITHGAIVPRFNSVNGAIIMHMTFALARGSNVTLSLDDYIIQAFLQWPTTDPWPSGALPGQASI